MKYAFVLDIKRGERLLTAVGPAEVLEENDRITFVGVVDAVNELRRMPGVSVAEDQTYQLDLQHSKRWLVEIVLSPSAPVVGHTVRESEFPQPVSAPRSSRSRARGAPDRQARDVILEPGDTLLVEADQGFVGAAQVQP